MNIEAKNCLPRPAIVGRVGSRVVRTLRTSSIVALALGTLALCARAQEPKVGDYFTDTSEFGFRVKVPLKWESIPAQPDDGNLVIKFDPKTNKYIQLSPDRVLDLHTWILKFDRRPQSNDGDQSLAKKFRHTDKNMKEWVKHNMAAGFRVDSQKTVEIDKIAATEMLMTDESDGSIKLYAMVYQLHPDVDIALVCDGPADPKKWSKYERIYEQLAHTFQPLEIKQPAGGEVAVGDSLRDKKRAELKAKMIAGWKLYETPHYFVVSNHDDKALLNELMERLEAVHGLYEIDYPPDRAKEIRASTAKTGPEVPAKPKADGKGEGDDGSDDEPQAQPVDAKGAALDPQEVAKTSVVRLCATEDQYYSYGGPHGSAGYWNFVAQELVLFVDKVGGVRGTWAVLNHEAFHQYIFYFYGNISPHSWYNEGTGDFYSGYEYKNKRFTLKKFDWRTGTIQEALRNSKPDGKKFYVPLHEFVRMTQREYYGETKFNTGPRENYAQGWSFIYFLRTGKKNNAKGWNPKWDSILDTYLRALASSGKLDQAVEQTFTGIDFDELERAWIDYTI